VAIEGEGEVGLVGEPGPLEDDLRRQLGAHGLSVARGPGGRTGLTGRRGPRASNGGPGVAAGWSPRASAGPARPAAGLVETLKGKGPFTVFAPTDEAFAKLPAGTVEGLLKEPAKLKDILLYHVVAGNVMAADAARLTSANTVLGQPITIKAEGGKVMINDATVVIADVKASNGVIHVIDKVLLPPTK
jgi:hypothetical protein